MSAVESSIRYNGTDLGGASYKLFVVSRGHQYQPKPEMNIKKLANADGVAAQGTSYGARFFSFECMVAASSAANRDTQLQNIADVFSVAQEGEKALVLGWMPTKQWQVRLLNALDFDVALTGGTFMLEFIAPDPDSTTYP